MVSSNRIVNALRNEGRIIAAVILQDMRTRFGRGSYIGYLITIAWPLSHMLIIFGSYLLVNTFAPIGNDPGAFVGSGLVPYILCLYPARQLGTALIQNRQLLSIPILKPMHVIAARLVVELVSAALVLFLFLSAMAVVGIDVWPNDVGMAVEAVCASLYLAVGFGILNVVLVALLGNFAIVAFILIMVGLYLSSGVYVPINMMPEESRSVMLLNPLCSLVSWMRSAYFSVYDDAVVNKYLVIGTASVTLLLGLLGERFARNKLLAG